MLDKKVEAKVDGNGNVVIQNADRATIIVNMDNPDEVKQALIDLQDRMDKIPLQIMEKLMEKSEGGVPVKGANVYFSLNYILDAEMYGRGGVMGISLGVTVTNTTKENRFFYEPSFKSSVPIEGTLDTFMMTESLGNKPQFPVKLEYGEPFFVYYKVNNMQVFQQLLNKDPEATIKAFANTTLGEVYFSNEYKLKDIIKDEKYVR